MNNGPMWSQDEHGFYWLLFPNKHALSKEEIREIFSNFGKVLNVTSAGDERGLRFVQFPTLEDVESAVENIKNHPTIKLVPHRPKGNKKDQNSNNASRDEPTKQQTANENPRRNFYQRKPPRNYDDTTAQTQPQSSNGTYKEEPIAMFEDKNSGYMSNNDNASVCSNASTLKANFSTQNTPKKNLLNHASPLINSVLTSPTNSIDKDDRAQMLLKLRGTNANTFSPSGLCSNVNNMNNTYDNEIPDLVTKDKIGLHKEPKKIILNAEEVIVANFHNNFSGAYFLHLFEQYEPLAISYVKTLPKSEIRYCHIYFKTARDSIEVETEFDKYNLLGKKLVVLRPCRLMEEAMYEV